MNRLRFGIIGTGKIVETILEAAKLDRRFVANAIYSRSWENANEFGKKHNIPYRYDSMESMFSSGYIDAVYIASPTSLHFKQANRALKYGLHVLCEKPLVSNSREAEELIKASHQQKVTVMEAMRSTLQPNFNILKSRLCEIGNVKHYFASYCKYSSRYDNFKAGIIENAFKPEFSNGATMDIGVYTIFPMIHLFGKPSEIKANSVVLHTGVDGESTVDFKFESGMTGKVIYSKISDSAAPSEIIGENGKFIIYPIHSLEQIDMISSDGATTTISQAQENSYYYEIKEFIDLVLNGSCESKMASLSISKTTIEVLDEIRKQIGVVFPADLI